MNMFVCNKHRTTEITWSVEECVFLGSSDGYVYSDLMTCILIDISDVHGPYIFPLPHLISGQSILPKCG
jgi:hypothetical protein